MSHCLTDEQYMLCLEVKKMCAGASFCPYILSESGQAS